MDLPTGKSAPQPPGEPLTASKLAAASVLVGCLIAAGFVLFLLMSTSQPAAEKNGETPPQATQLPPTRPADTVDMANLKARETSSSTAIEPAKKPKKSRGKRRGAAGTQSNSKYKNALVLSGGGKPPKMMQPQ
jgi:hypothetical protein